MSKIVLQNTGFQINSVAFSRDGKKFVSGSSDGRSSITIWDAFTGKEMKKIPDRFWNVVNSVAFSPDGTKVVSGSAGGDKTIKIWDVSTGELIRSFEYKNIRSVAYSPDGKMIASGGVDAFVKLWDTSTGTLIRQMVADNDQVNSVAFSPDGTRVVSGSYYDVSGTFKLWDTSTGELIRSFEEKNQTTAVAYSPDGTMIAYGEQSYGLLDLHTHGRRPDYKVVICKIYEGRRVRRIKTLNAHKGRVTSVAFNQSGKLLVSGSFDQTIKVWNVSNGVELTKLKLADRNPLNYPTHVAFSTAGIEKIVSGGATIKLWDFSLCRSDFTCRLLSNDVEQLFKENEISYTYDIEEDKIIVHVVKKNHPLLLDIIVSREGYRVERPGSRLSLENMITKKACENINKQVYKTIEELIFDLYRSFAYSPAAKLYREKYRVYTLKL